jgi:hypothetical protein
MVGNEGDATEPSVIGELEPYVFDRMKRFFL